MDSDSDVESEAPSDLEGLSGEERFFRNLQRIKNNDSRATSLEGSGIDFGPDEEIQNVTNEEWEEIGRDISNNTHLKKLLLYDDALEDENISYLFRGLTSSSSLKKLYLEYSDLKIAGVRSMVPFLQNANNLKRLDLGGNNLQSEGFNFLCRALRDSPTKELSCRSCGIESIVIEIDHFPRHLTKLELPLNDINADGCREIARLLQGGDSVLECLDLDRNKIDDKGVAILVDALRNNTSLKYLGLMWNDGITKEGLVMLLKLVNDISTVKATLQSNHTLRYILFDQDEEVHHHINMATDINTNHVGNPEAAGRDKVIQTQLHSAKRAALAKIQGVSQSVYSEINPLHLPEVLSLVGCRHGQGELYVALKSSIADLLSTVSRRQCIKQRLADLAAESEQLHAELAELDAATGGTTCAENEVRSKKRRRKWWWGIWGNA